MPKLRAKNLIDYLPFLVFGVAIVVRLISLSFPFGDFDEGVYLATVRSVIHGFPLIAKTYNSQGPLFIYLAEIFYKLSPTITTVRLFSVLSSLLVIYLAFTLVDRYVGRVAALFCASYLALDTAFLSVSRTFQVDIPWLACSLASFYFLLRYQETSRRKEILASALLFAISLFLKVNPLYVPVIVAYFLIATRDRGLKSALPSLYFPLMLLIVFVLLIRPDDIPAFYTNTIGVRTSHAIFALGEWRHGVRRLLLLHEWPLLLTALISLALLLGLRRHKRQQLPLFIPLSLIWLLATFIGFNLYDPLFMHHAVFLILPASLVAAYAIQAGFDHAKKSRTQGFVFILLLGILVTYASLQGTALTRLLHPHPSNYDRDLLETAAIIKARTKKDDYIVTDAPLVLYLANRNTPPELVDPSSVRIQSGLLSDKQIIDLTRRYHPTAVLFLSGRFNGLPGYRSFLEQNYTQTELKSGSLLFFEPGR